MKKIASKSRASQCWVSDSTGAIDSAWSHCSGNVTLPWHAVAYPRRMTAWPRRCVTIFCVRRLRRSRNHSFTDVLLTWRRGSLRLCHPQPASSPNTMDTI